MEQNYKIIYISNYISRVINKSSKIYDVLENKKIKR